MKQLTKNLLKMKFNGINLADVSKIEFAFSQNINSTPLKVAEYPGDDVIDLDNNMLGVIWTAKETALFEGGKTFFADTRITMKESTYQPETQIIRLQMTPTLFKEV